MYVYIYMYVCIHTFANARKMKGNKEMGLTTCARFHGRGRKQRPCRVGTSNSVNKFTIHKIE